MIRRRMRREAAGRLQRDNLRRDLPQSCGQTLQSSRIALDYKRFSTRTNSDIETILRHVDPDSDHVHGDPSLPNRASRSAAPATVRVRWNDERGAKLRRFMEFFDGAQSWSRVERIIARVEAGAEGPDINGKLLNLLMESTFL